MAEDVDVGQVLKDVRAMLGWYEAALGRDPFEEFGREPGDGRAFLANLNDSQNHLRPVIRLMASARSGNACAETLEALRQLSAYVSAVLAEGRGSVNNTHQALRLLDVARTKLRQLMDQLGIVSGPVAGPPPVADDETSAPPRPRHPDAAEKGDPSPLGAADKNESSSPAAEAPAPPAPLIRPPELVKVLSDKFSVGELRALSHSLDMNPDELGQGSISSMALELVRYTQRHDQYPALVAKVLELRPNLMSAAKSPPPTPWDNDGGAATGGGHG